MMFSEISLIALSMFSPDLDTHHNHVNQVLERLLANHLYVKAGECFMPTLSLLLGFILASGSVEMDPAKDSPVSEWPPPRQPQKGSAVPRVF